MKFAIFDWAMNRLFPDKTFATFEDGWAFIHSQEGLTERDYDDYFVYDLNEMREWGVGQ